MHTRSVSPLQWACTDHTQGLLASLAATPELKKAAVLVDVGEQRQAVEAQGNVPLIPPADLVKLRATLAPTAAPATVASTLYDLELASARAPALLVLFTQELIRLLAAPGLDEETVTAAHRLLVRLVQSSPRYLAPPPRTLLSLSCSEAETVVAASVRCLASPADVPRRVAVKQSVDVFHYSREHSASYLIALFQQGKSAAWELRQLLTVTHSLLK